MPALSLSPAERSALRSQAHALKPVVLIGAEGLTDAVLKEIKVHLDAHQLIKIRVFGDERDTRIAIYDEICDRLNAAPIQHIGKLLVIWKPEAAVAAPARGRRAGALPSAAEAADDKKGRAPRTVKVVKVSPNASPVRRPRPVKVTVRGNERVTAGGTVKRAKSARPAPSGRSRTSNAPVRHGLPCRPAPSLRNAQRRAFRRRAPADARSASAPARFRRDRTRSRRRAASRSGSHTANSRYRCPHPSRPRAARS